MERIVVGIDETPAAADAARFALDEGEARGWPVTAVLCWSYPGRHGEGPEAPGLAGTRCPSPALDRLLDAALGERAGAVVDRVDEVDFAVAGLLHHVDTGDLLVLGPRTRGLAHGVVRGSITQRCLRASPCPVAVVHDHPARPVPGQVTVGVDGSSTARTALRWALAAARARGVTCEVLHTWEVPLLTHPHLDPTDPIHRKTARAALDQIVSELEAEGITDVDVRPALVEGPASDVLLERSERGDLVVVGSRGLTGAAGVLLGSTSTRLTQLAANPVVIVPPT